MLDVSLCLTSVLAMLISIFLPGRHFEVDGLNGPTTELIPGGMDNV